MLDEQWDKLKSACEVDVQYITKNVNHATIAEDIARIAYINEAVSKGDMVWMQLEREVRKRFNKYYPEGKYPFYIDVLGPEAI